MNQISLSQTGFELSAKRTRKRIFLDEMQRIIPWDILVGMIAKHAPNGANGRPPFAVSTMLRIAVEFMDGPAGHLESTTEGAGMIAPKMRKDAKKWGENTHPTNLGRLDLEK